MDEAKALHLAETYLEMDRPRRALEFVARASPYSTRAWWVRARALDQLGRVDEAEEAVRSGLALDGECAELHAQLAILRFGRKDMLGAEKAVHEALRLEPHNGGFVALHALVLAHTDRPNAAHRRMRQAIALAPEEKRLLLTGAIVAMKRAEHEIADELTRELVTAEPELPEAHFMRAFVLASRNARKAVPHFREAARLQPGHRPYVLAARVAEHPLMWLWRFTSPAGYYVAWAGMVVGVHFAMFARSYTLLYCCLGVMLYFFIANIVIAIAGRPQ